MQKMLRLTTSPLEVNRLPRTDVVRLVFEAAAIRILHSLPEGQACVWRDTDALISKYGSFKEFENLPAEELRKLLEFRNMMACALKLLPPKLEHLLDLVVSSL